MKKYLLLLPIILIAFVAIRFSFYTVNPAEYVYVTSFGQHVATYDGGNSDEDAGLHWGLPWPITKVQRLDRRIRFLDLPTSEVVTHSRDGKQEDRLIVDGYVCWRIASKEKVDLFIRRLVTLRKAEIDIGEKINSHLSGILQQKSTKDLINTNPVVVESAMKQVRDNLTMKLQSEFRNEFGVELVDIRLRRFSYAPEVRSKIFERIISERQKKAQEYRSEGAKIAAEINSKADKEARIIKAEARKKEKLIKGAADVSAIEIRNKAHSKDPKFYAFQKSMESLAQILGDNKTVLLLSSHRWIFDRFFNPPQGTLIGNRPGAALTNKNGKKNGGTKNTGGQAP